MKHISMLVAVGMLAATLVSGCVIVPLGGGYGGYGGGPYYRGYAGGEYHPYSHRGW